MDADFIRTARRKIGMTQGQLAERLGVDQGTISRWERSHMAPRPRIASAIRELLLEEEERRVRDRSLALVRLNMMPATLLDRDLRLREVSPLAVQHYAERGGIDIRKQIGTSMQRHFDRVGMSDLARHVKRSGLVSGDALLFRFVINTRGKGHATLYEPIFDNGEVTSVLCHVTSYFDFSSNDETSLELSQFVSKDEPTRFVDMHRGARADHIPF